MPARQSVGALYYNRTPPAELEALMFSTLAESAEFRNSFTPPTLADVFTDWNRFSGANWFPTGTTPTGEATAFVYNSASNQIRCTANTVSFVGFISPDKTNDYDFAVTLSSGGQDDDMIGIVLAFWYDDSTGVMHIVSAERDSGGLGGGESYPGKSATENYVAWYRRWGGGQGLYVKKLGTSTDPASVRRRFSSSSGGWASSGATRLYVERRGSEFECWCTAFAQAGTDPQANTGSYFTFSAANDADLTWLRSQSAQYGYICQSQDDARFSNVDIRGALDLGVIYIAEENAVYRYDSVSETWVKDESTTPSQELGDNVRLTNPETGRVYGLNPYGKPYLA